LSTRRAVIVFAACAGILVAATPPAGARSEAVQERSVSGVPNGKSGRVVRFADRTPGREFNSVTIYADDADGPGNRCTETWVDYSTNPHEHFNPGVLVNCSGGNRSVSGAMANRSWKIRSMVAIVCDVPNTSGPITRNRNNCRGQLGTIYLHSGQSYADFEVKASQYPSGILVYRV
jgi:hypothetical protein